MPKKNEFKLKVVSVRLVKDAPLLSEKKIMTPEDAINVVGSVLSEMDREIICVINLKGDSTPINCHFASMGAVNQALAHPRELFKSSILSNAANMILVHNHPSGNLIPSKSDTIMTDRMVKLCELMGIPLVDHIIVGGDNRQFFSFKEKGLMPNPHIMLSADYQTMDFQSPLVAERGKAR